MNEDDPTVEVKPPRVNVQAFLASGGRLSHIKKGKRVITIAYRVVPGGDIFGLLQYGASIFTQDPPVLIRRIKTRKNKDGTLRNVIKDRYAPPEIWNKHTRRQNNEQAVRRCLTAPVEVIDPVSTIVVDNLPSGQVDYMRRRYLRDQLPKYGVEHKTK